MKIPVTHFYYVRDPGRWAWARIWITDDGCITTISDYGSFGYWFGSPGCEFRKFLLGIHTEYLVRKFTQSDKSVCNPEKSFKAIKREICERRRHGSLDRLQAREEWELVHEHREMGVQEQVHWYEATRLEATEIFVYEKEHVQQAEAFAEHVWPLFREQLQAELAEEALGAPGTLTGAAAGHP